MNRMIVGHSLTFGCDNIRTGAESLMGCPS